MSKFLCVFESRKLRRRIWFLLMQASNDAERDKWAVAIGPGYWGPGGGYFHRNAIRGRAAQMGRFLTKNPQTWVPFLAPKSLNMGPFFVKITKIFWARNASPENFHFKKSLNMGPFFEQNP